MRGVSLDENGHVFSWQNLFGQMGHYDPETTIIRLRPVINISDISHDVIATFTLDDLNPNIATLTFDTNTLPATTITAVQDFIDPKLIFPGNGISLTPTTGTRYVITKDLITNTVAWGAFSAKENDIIEYNGTNWFIASSFESLPIGTIIKNLNNNKLYVTVSTSWVLCIEGLYNQGYWRTVFFEDY